ncbi:MAG: hypothetical protein KAW16_04045 [candidate division Zixibacteria bacterium]|nr:hypothetical protein [candidate division Zixibacteria bacterium]
MKKIVSIFITVLVLGSYSNVQSSEKVEQAKVCFENYVKALKSGDEEKAKEYWNKKEKQRYKIFDWQLKDMIFKKINLQRSDYKIRKAEEKEEYIIMHVDWYYPEDSSKVVQKDTRYFIRERGKMVGANHIFIFTRDWLKKESKHFVYHFKTNKEEPDQKLLNKMDRFYEKIGSFLEVDYQEKIDYFRCESAEEVGMLFNLERSFAQCDMINGVVAGVQDFVPHEVVHIISYRLLPQNEKKLPPLYLNEGLAYFLGGATFFAPDLMLSWAKRRIAGDEGVSLNTLIQDPFNYGSNDGPSLISSLAKFMIETYGLSKFKQIYKLGGIFKERRQNLEKTYQRKIEQVDKEWKNFVLSLSLPEIKVGVSLEGLVLTFVPKDSVRGKARPEGKEIFQISDPRGDDKGDGDYTYPENEKTIPGMFDLIDFKIGKDDELVYFQLEFSDLIHAEIDLDRGFNGTFAAIVIDADNVEGSGNTRLFFDNGNFLLSEKDAYEFVIEVSNAGILVYDQDWVWQLLFLKAFSEKSHIHQNKFVFAIPQKIIGSLDSNWKIQVMSGGQWGGYENTAHGAGNFMKVEKRAKKDEGGGGTEEGFNSNVYDILATEGLDQTKILGNYDRDKKKKVVIPLIRLKRIPTDERIKGLNNPVGVD